MISQLILGVSEDVDPKNAGVVDFLIRMDPMAMTVAMVAIWAHSQDSSVLVAYFSETRTGSGALRRDCAQLPIRRFRGMPQFWPQFTMRWPGNTSPSHLQRNWQARGRWFIQLNLVDSPESFLLETTGRIHDRIFGTAMPKSLSIWSRG
jgi:hypothetical protein